MSQTKPSWYAIRKRTPIAAAVQGAASAAEIWIYGDIGESYWEETTSAKSFIEEINALDVDDITIRINSIGGSVPDGLAIYNAIKRHKATVTTEVDGIAFSIASLIAQAGDKRHMAANAMLMMHAPWAYTEGNAIELRDFADQLDTWAAAMATSHAAASGRPVEKMMALLTDGKDHFYTAEEALTEKFIDAITDALPVVASAARDMPVNRYRSLPAALQDSGVKPVAAPAASTVAPATQPQETEMNKKFPLHALAAMLAPVGAVGPDTSGTGTGDAAVAAARAQVLAADNTRRAGIRASFAKFATRDGVPALQQTCEDDHACTVEAAGTKLLAILAQGVESVNGGRVVTVEDESDKQRGATENALLARAGVVKADTANPYRGFTLSEMARASLTRAGYRHEGQDKKTFVGAAFTHSTSDFPLILGNVANKSMLKGYTEAEETFQRWTRAGELPDFKPGTRVDLNMFPSLRKVPEGAEYKYATIGERGATVVLATYGELFSITRQAIINDDIGAFTRIPQLMGRAAIRTIGDLVYAILTSNPVMSDGTPLFHANHGNLLMGSAITTASVDAMGAAMAMQKQGSSVLNIGLQYLIVPRALRGAANVVRASEFEVGSGAARNNTTPNSVRDTFEVISDARLDAASATAWYGAANPSAADTIEVSYLDGVQTPFLEQKDGWNVDGTEFKVRMDAGVAPIDWKTLAKNPGA